jgi:hypothetical protein
LQACNFWSISHAGMRDGPFSAGVPFLVHLACRHARWTHMLIGVMSDNSAAIE